MENPDRTSPDPSDRGATATEYAVLCGFLALVIMFGVAAFGTNVNSYYGHLVAAVKSALGLA